MNKNELLESYRLEYRKLEKFNYLILLFYGLIAAFAIMSPIFIVITTKNKIILTLSFLSYLLFVFISLLLDKIYNFIIKFKLKELKGDFLDYNYNHIYHLDCYNLVPSSVYSVHLDMKDGEESDVCSLLELSDSMSYLLSIDNIGTYKISFEEAFRLMIAKKDKKLILLEDKELEKLKNNLLIDYKDLNCSFV